ncbi:MAG TPA: hypothetical protein VGG78_03080 [Gemmatimonadaceae bacterium]|jgi:hypothetical protein
MTDDLKGDRDLDPAVAKEGSDAALQKEMRREEGEGRDLPGDTRANRNLTGSSTWETLPDDTDAADGSSSKS